MPQTTRHTARSLLLRSPGPQRRRAAAPASPPPRPPPTRPPASPSGTGRRTLGASFVYHDDQEAGRFAILEMLGGGLALRDFDRDGQLDLLAAGGGAMSARGNSKDGPSATSAPPRGMALHPRHRGGASLLAALLARRRRGRH